MSDREIAKKGYEAATKEQQQEKIDKVKRLVLLTLEKIEEVRLRKRDDEEVLRILNQDLKDLKEGRLDRIEERQKMMPRAKEISIIHVEKAQIVDQKNENDPYQARWYTPFQVFQGAGTGAAPYVPGGYTSQFMNDASVTVHNSFIKDHVGGTYKLASGSVISL